MASNQWTPGSNVPKDRDERRRRAAPARGEWIDLPAIEHGEFLPALPAKDHEGLDWEDRTIEMWEAWRADPVTQMWSPADKAYAMETIRLYDRQTTKTQSDIRIRMDGLGLTPKGKRDLRYRCEAETRLNEGTDSKQQRRQVQSRSDSRRARLAAVPDPQ